MAHPSPENLDEKAKIPSETPKEASDLSGLKAAEQAEHIIFEGDRIIGRQKEASKKGFKKLKKAKTLKGHAKGIINKTSFVAAAAGVNRALNFWNPNNLKGRAIKKGAEIAGGMAGVLGLAEPASRALNAVVPEFAGSKQLSQKTLKGLEHASIAKGTLNALNSAFAKQIEATVIRKIQAFVSKDLIQKIGGSMGLRGSILAFTLADDATVIGILDDWVAAGMAVWMANDIAEIVFLTRKILKVKAAMESFPPMSEATIAGADEASKDLILNVLLPPDQITEKMSEEEKNYLVQDALGKMTEEERNNFIHSFPDLKIKVTWPDSRCSAIYRFGQGEIYSATVTNKAGEVWSLSDKELNQDIALPPPTEFEKWKIDYYRDTQNLLSSYRTALLYTKSECGWTKLNYEIVDDHTIILKRHDASDKITLSRTGETWSVGSYSTGKDLFQAIVLGNFINKMKGILEKGKEDAGSKRPFYEDNWNIMFDRKNNIWNNLNVLSSGEWMTFFKSNKMGVDKYEIMDALNNWYEAEYGKLMHA